MACPKLTNGESELKISHNLLTVDLCGSTSDLIDRCTTPPGQTPAASVLWSLLPESGGFCRFAKRESYCIALTSIFP